jgi:AGZA family xanthine/uracil permease-like MFS transporter
MTGSDRRYRAFVLGDINGFFGLMFDNITVLSFLAGILVFGFGYPAGIVYGRMFPGTAFGVLFGDLVYTWMAFRLARTSGNPRVTAMPLGLDTPSTIGIALVVLGPPSCRSRRGHARGEAALMTWYIGMATMVMIGVIKLALSFAGGWIQRMVPQAGLLGSLAGIGLALIGFIPLVDIFGMPLVGMVSLGLILYNLVAGIRLPRNFPGVLAAIAVGTALYHLLGPQGLVGGTTTAPSVEFHLGFPLRHSASSPASWLRLKYLPIAVPFALLTVVGGSTSPRARGWRATTSGPATSSSPKPWPPW